MARVVRRVMDVRSCGELYAMLVETVRSMGTYHAKKAFLVNEFLQRELTVTVEGLAARLGISRGEAFVLLRETRLWYHEVEEEIEISRFFSPSYNRAGIGGTFDKLHIGHLSLLLTAFRHAERVFIGVTSDDFSAKLGKTHPVGPLEGRLESLRRALDRYGWTSRAEIDVIEEPLGPPATDPDFDLLVVSPFTVRRGEEVNSVRIGRGLNPIRVEICPLVLAEDGKPISTTRIYRGEVRSDGRVI